MSVVHVDISLRLGALHMAARLDVGAEVLVLFGPSGAGKTTILNAIAGLVRPDAGEIVLDGRTVFRETAGAPRVLLPPRERRVGYVFQNYALFPHMTALQNVEYPLRRRPDRRDRALGLLARLGMEQHAGQRPDQLSGGQQQRVAIARALALDSRVLLLDEPFAAVDAGVRARLMQDLRQLQRDRELAVIVVTHDIDDAFTTGDRLAVMRDGRIEQVGPVADVFLRPASDAVADVVGIRNMIRGRVVDVEPEPVIDWDGMRLQLERGTEPPRMGELVTAYISPEDVKLIYPDRPAGAALLRNRAGGTITAARFAAGHRVLHVRLDNGAVIEARFPRFSYSHMRLDEGARVELSLRPSGIVMLGEDQQHD